MNAKPAHARLCRLAAVLAARGLTRSTFAARCSVSDPHLRCVILGERRPSERLADRIKAELGADAWAFVRGESDTLTLGRP